MLPSRPGSARRELTARLDRVLAHPVLFGPFPHHLLPMDGYLSAFITTEVLCWHMDGVAFGHEGSHYGELLGMDEKRDD